VKEREQTSVEFRSMSDPQHQPILVPNRHRFELAVVLELMECLQRILGCATDHHTFVSAAAREKAPRRISC
jgi:hypothetical protein